MSKESSPTILVAEDDDSLADLYTEWLEPDYEVRRAHDGDEAVELIDESVDVMLLDRQMPGRSGDAVLDALDDEDYSCRVAMITGVVPDFAIIDLGCDKYLTKPVSGDELRATVDWLLQLKDYDEQVQSYYTLVGKKTTLETQKSTAELTGSPEYWDLVEKLADLQKQLNAKVRDLDDEDYTDLYQDLPTSSRPPSANYD